MLIPNRFILLIILVFNQNCFLNPIVQNLISPEEVEENSNLFSLLALQGKTLVTPSGTATTEISGKLTDLSFNPLTNATLSIFSFVSTQAKSFTRVEVSPTAFTDINGNFSFPLNSGSFTVNVTDSNGSSLGSFDLVVNSTGNNATSSYSSDAKFLISSLNATTISENFFIGGLVIGSVWGPALCGPDFIVLTNTSNGDTIPISTGMGNFFFPTLLTANTSYSVGITTPSSYYTCSIIANGSGIVTTSNITDITIDCGSSCL